KGAPDSAVSFPALYTTPDPTGARPGGVFGRRVPRPCLRRRLSAPAVAHRMPFEQPDPFLSGQIPQNCTYRSPQPPVDHRPPIFRNEEHMILAFPSHMCQTLRMLA